MGGAAAAAAGGDRVHVHGLREVACA
eukprot:COSAG02_NODE_41775_length_391_cov_0.705479_1_plen_25_part_10